MFSTLSFLTIYLTASYASFPVQRTTTNNTTTVVQKEELTSPAAAAGGKSQVIALVLCALIGGIGIHRFYLGYTWQGIIADYQSNSKKKVGIKLKKDSKRK